MSYGIRLVDPENDYNVMHTGNRHQEGGNYVAFVKTADGQILQGTADCEIHVTYNYSTIYSRVFPQGTARENPPYSNKGDNEGIKWLYGRTAEESIPVLEQAVEQLGTERDTDYWKATDGNAGRALNTLLGWARENPNGIWWVL